MEIIQPPRKICSSLRPHSQQRRWVLCFNGISSISTPFVLDWEEVGSIFFACICVVFRVIGKIPLRHFLSQGQTVPTLSTFPCVRDAAVFWNPLRLFGRIAPVYLPLVRAHNWTHYSKWKGKDDTLQTAGDVPCKAGGCWLSFHKSIFLPYVPLVDSQGLFWRAIVQAASLQWVIHGVLYFFHNTCSYSFPEARVLNFLWT